MRELGNKVPIYDPIFLQEQELPRVEKLNSEKMVLLSVSGVKLVNSMSISKDPQAS
jgi:hypothetical protein